MKRNDTNFNCFCFKFSCSGYLFCFCFFFTNLNKNNKIINLFKKYSKNFYSFNLIKFSSRIFNLYRLFILKKYLKYFVFIFEKNTSTNKKNQGKFPVIQYLISKKKYHFTAI